MGGDSGFDSALSSRSSSIRFEESPNFGQLYDESEELYVSKLTSSDLNKKFSKILTSDEYIRHDDEIDDLFFVVNQVTGVETLYKAPSSIKFDDSPSYSTTFGSEEYKRGSPIPRSQLFNSRLEYELEKQVAKMTLVEVDLTVNSEVSPPSSLGIRVIGVNMIHGVQDKLNIYVKRVVEDSVAGCDGRIRVNDHIVEVNGISLVGVSQKLAAQTLSNCAICPETGTVHFVLARPPLENGDLLEKSGQANLELEEKAAGEENLATTLNQEKALASKDQEMDAKRQRLKNEEASNTSMDTTENNLEKIRADVDLVEDKPTTTAQTVACNPGRQDSCKEFTRSPHPILKAQTEPEFEGRDAVRLTKKEEG